MLKLILSLLSGDELRKSAVKANRRIRRVNLPIPRPSQVNDCESIRMVKVAIQNVILIEAKRHCLD